MMNFIVIFNSVTKMGGGGVTIRSKFIRLNVNLRKLYIEKIGKGSCPLSLCCYAPVTCICEHHTINSKRFRIHRHTQGRCIYICIFYFKMQSCPIHETSLMDDDLTLHFAQWYLSYMYRTSSSDNYIYCLRYY